MKDYGMKLLREGNGELSEEKISTSIKHANEYLKQIESHDEYNSLRYIKDYDINGRTITMHLGESGLELMRLTISDDSHYLMVTGSLICATFYLDGGDGFYQPLYPVAERYLMSKAQAIPSDTPYQLLADFSTYKENLSNFLAQYNEDDFDIDFNDYLDLMEEAIDAGNEYDYMSEGCIALMVKYLDEQLETLYSSDDIGYENRSTMIELAITYNKVYRLLANIVNAIGLF
ncbi:hypothetical protein RND61_15425 [Streptomyces sp. TRM76323]|uniref:Uncharacterized protein n=1 Tax=Streptomyces tamarix TaxID=3078565 RepID=A0ABU3QL29_9ACTN|nr:hypothetical protein [Streptomyces tamarix]MDT9683439.1 hypothetical protein [Streptomyces tamarix]